MAEFVGDAITSILQQTFTNFEFIIIDDASDDGIAAIINSYQDNRIVYCKNDRNQGNYYSRNKGLQLAKGKYIAIMDADDIAFADRLEKQYEYLNQYPDLLAVGSDCIYLPSKQKHHEPKTYKDIQLALLWNSCFIHSSLMVRKDILCQLGGYNEKYFYAADYDLVCRLALVGKIENLPDILVQYRCHPTQISTFHHEEQSLFADSIRIQYQLSFINKYKKESMAAIKEPDISYPDMGRVIGYYTYAAYACDSQVELLADNLLDEIIDKLSTEMPICLKNGILGVGCGLIYLLRNGLVEGNENEILFEIDQMLLGALIHLEDETEVDWYGWLYYFHLRMLSPDYSDFSIDCLIFRQYAIYMLDCLQRGIRKGMKWDNRIIEEVEAFHQMEISSVKTAEILSLLRSIENDIVTFVIPLRVDSPERERNLDLLLDTLVTIEHAEVHILEADNKSRYRLKKNYCNVVYRFVKDLDPVFYRTKYLNCLLQEAEGSIVGIWDTDIMMPEIQILDAIREIKVGKAIMSYPYDGCFYSLTPERSELFVQDKSYKKLEEQEDDRNLTHGAHSVGGAFFVNKKMYLQAGGENEHFYGWGPEDAERAKRMEILGLPIYRAKGPLYHLYHPRKENSWYGSQEIELKNRREFLKVCSMTRDELLQYIQTWNTFSED